jgi:hypothetical protein
MRKGLFLQNLITKHSQNMVNIDTNLYVLSNKEYQIFFIKKNFTISHVRSK